MTDQQRPLRGRNHLGKQAKSGSGYDDCSDDENVADIDYAPSIEDTGSLQKTRDPQQLSRGRSGGIKAVPEGDRLTSNSSPATLGAARGLGHTLNARPATPQSRQLDTLEVVGSDVQRRSQRGVLREIKYIEGETKIFPAILKQSMQDFLDVNLDANLSCAQREFKPGSSLQRTPNGDVRQWSTHPEGEPLQMSYFRYGTDQKILVAQAFPGSRWHMAEPRIIVHAGGGNKNFKVWCGQRALDTIPDESGVVRWSKVSEDYEDEEEEDKQDDVGMNLGPGPGFRKLRTSLGARQPDLLQDTAPTTTESSDSSSTSVPPRPASSAGPCWPLTSVTEARKTKSLSPTKNAKRRRGGGRYGLDGKIPGPKAKKVRTGRYSSTRDIGKDHPFEFCHINDKHHSVSMVPHLTEDLKRMSRGNGLTNHLQRRGNNKKAHPVSTVESDPAPATSFTQPTEQTRHVIPGIPIRQSPMPQQVEPQSLRGDNQIGTSKDEVETDFDISTTTVFFVDGHDQNRYDCPFSDTLNIQHLFIRARVAKVATKDTILLEGVVGDEKVLMQKDRPRDFDMLKTAIMNQKVMEITIREEME